MNRLKFGIRSKITVGYIVIILCLLVSVIFLNAQITSLQNSRNQIIQYDSQVQTLTNNIEKNIKDMESNKRGYVITGETSYLEPYNNASVNWKVDYDKLRQLVAENPAQLQLLDDIKVTIDHWIANSGDPVIQMKKENRSEDLAAFFQVDLGRKDMEAIQSQFESFLAIEKANIDERAAALDGRNQILTFGLFALLIIISLIAIGISSGISRMIVNTIGDVTETIRKIALSGGGHGERIKVNTQDEVRDLANATNFLLDTLEKREWLQKNLADIVTTYQGVSSVTKLGQTFLSELADRTDTSYGAFYVRETVDNKVSFVKQASFADEDTSIGRENFKLGEGLIGQAAADKRMYTYKGLPKDYRMIGTGLGETPPKQIVILPVIFEDETIAVIELATMKEYDEQQLELVKQIADSFGLTVNSILGRMEIVRLLNESRAMTEELQVQSEELQTQSEELQTQSEELQMQTDALSAINKQLEERTKDAETKSRDLEKAKKELEEIAEQLQLNSNYKSEFLANMSHELRTPLNSILILSEMLVENGSNNLSDEETEFAKVIHSSGEDLLSLINDILDLSKVEAGKIDVLFGEVNLSELPTQMDQLFSPVAKRKNIEFNITQADSIPEVFYTDAKKFQQILKNLLSNAFKFTEQGSVSLNINRLHDQHVTSCMQNISPDWLEVSVTDTGIGIPEDKHQLIFETFQQADGATVRKYGGSGLGLSICREFSKLLGAKITLESEEGKGSTFTLVIPSLPNGIGEEEQMKLSYAEISAASAADYDDIEELEELEAMEASRFEEQPVEEQEEEKELAALSPQNELEVFQNKRVLIVDDDNRNIYALKRVLENRGMETLVAKDGLECLDIMKEDHNIDVVLMDIMMPNMDGYETMSIIRNEMKLTDLPIIALTAKAMKNDRDKSLEAGASDYISKPLNLEQLFSVLRVWLVSKGVK
ncbi:CHASE3 domain-containing protein [Lysinibacillus sp. 3P01SB]|uniref:CHASE3 domain-containing protein n=1 Tax=Lysinibacillus sp. 3P01SB TaxID=3132284 RepID=UPI0039A59CCA